MTLQELLNDLYNKVDEDYAERVNDAAWVNGIWSWDNALKAHAEGQAVLAKIEEIKRLAEQYQGQAS